MTLEELLNSLIQRGWKPFGITCTDFIKGTGLEWIPSYCFNPHPHVWFPWWTRRYHRPSLRQIVSKESWLWQFVCEDRLIEPDHMKQYNWYEYRITQSALCDEDKLEKFLLDNIKTDGTTK